MMFIITIYLRCQDFPLGLHNKSEKYKEAKAEEIT
jgi:hypothetical protein